MASLAKSVAGRPHRRASARRRAYVGSGSGRCMLLMVVRGMAGFLHREYATDAAIEQGQRGSGRQCGDVPPGVGAVVLGCEAARLGNVPQADGAIRPLPEHARVVVY